MRRSKGSQLYHRLICALTFGKRQVPANLSKAQICEAYDMICHEISSESIIVVNSSIPGFNQGGLVKFGMDQSWHNWCGPQGLMCNFGIGRDPEMEQQEAHVVERFIAAGIPAGAILCTPHTL